MAAEVAQSTAAGGGAAHPPLQRDRGVGQAGAALAGLGQIDPPHPLAEERAQPLHHGGIAVDIGHHHPGIPPGQQPLRLPRRGGLEPQGFFQKHGLAPLHRALGIGQVELVGSAEHHCVHHVQQLLQAGGHPYPVKPVPDAQPPAALQGAAAYGGDGTAPRLGQKALHVPVGDGHRFSASLHHSTERDVCKAVSAQAEQAAQVDALGLEGGQVEHAAEQQAG